MNKKIIFFKQLTAAEVGNTNTHEKYVRIKNEFNPVEFFQSELEKNGSVLEKVFTAKNLTKGHESDEPLTLRFVHFINNANQEKRIPSLGKLFEANNVCENDIVLLESIVSGDGPSFYITFFKPDKLQISPNQFYCTFEEEEEIRDESASSSIPSLQRIYYGAPGTGKSYKVKEIVESGNNNFVRTTFHPDSDYSTFVGCYKPTMDGDRITYSFVSQAFLQAYVEAWRLYVEAVDWKEPMAEYLVIEEINRGNCAQIFGDLFQLLDRNEYGFSDYFINADQDLSKYLSDKFSNLNLSVKFDDAKKEGVNRMCKRDVVDKVLSGEIMLLPSNLYIMATMNTSDQSLFPIDSAFKRRWDWVYVPIAKGADKETGKELEWNIEVGTEKYDWWDFLEAINAKIGEATNSEDKKLGFFFCQAKEGVIDTHTFVNKVLFYLWNDVFKDLGDEGGLFNKEKDERITFDMFHDKEKGKEKEKGVELVEYWIKKVMGIKDENKKEEPTPEQ